MKMIASNCMDCEQTWQADAASSNSKGTFMQQSFQVTAGVGLETEPIPEAGKFKIEAPYLSRVFLCPFVTREKESCVLNMSLSQNWRWEKPGSPWAHVSTSTTDQCLCSSGSSERPSDKFTCTKSLVNTASFIAQKHQQHGRACPAHHLGIFTTPYWWPHSSATFYAIFFSTIPPPCCTELFNVIIPSFWFFSLPSLLPPLSKPHLAVTPDLISSQRTPGFSMQDWHSLWCTGLLLNCLN